MEHKLILPLEDSISNKDEVAILLDNDSIFSLKNSLYKLLEFYGFEPRRFCETNNESIQMFKDNYGNILTVTYCNAMLEGIFEDREIKISGILVDPIAEQYIPRTKSNQKINLRNLIKAYPKNRFSESLEKIRNHFIRKARQQESYTSSMYI